jgi:DNA polymerase-3 subunit epsilon
MLEDPPIDPTSLLAFDLETTGLVPGRDQPVSYALAYRAGERIETDYELVAPTVPIAPEAEAVHGISAALAATGVPVAEAVRRLGATLVEASRARRTLVGMNIAFDLTILDRLHRGLVGTSLEEAGWHGPVMDVWVIEEVCSMSRSGSRTLAALAERHGVVQSDAHNARGDAITTLLVAEAQLAEFALLRQRGAKELGRLQAREHLRRMRNRSDARRERGLEGFEIPSGWPIDPPLAS